MSKRISPTNTNEPMLSLLIHYKQSYNEAFNLVDPHTTYPSDSYKGHQKVQEISNELEKKYLQEINAYIEDRELKARVDAIKSYKKLNKLLENAIRLDELEKLSKSKWADLAYDIPFYLKDRIAELRKTNGKRY